MSSKYEKNIKIISLLLIVGASVVSLVLVLAALGVFENRAAMAQEAYNAMGDMTLKDESILTTEERQTLSDMRSSREQMLQKQDVEGLESLNAQWESFRAPFDQFTSQYESIMDNSFTSNEKSLLTAEETQTADALQAQIISAYQGRDSTALQAAGDQWDMFSSNIREVFQIYNDIDQTPFSNKEQNLMTQDQRDRMKSLQTETETALVQRDSSGLSRLQSDWNSYTSGTKQSIEQAKEKLLSDWVDGADFGASLGNLFSLGTTTSSTTINGHTITITTQYNTDQGLSDNDIKTAMDSYLNMTSSVFQSGVDYLHEYVDDVVIRIEYKNKNGNVVSSKEFK